MREITARAYQVTRLDDAQVNILHERERLLGYPGTPSMIKKKFGLSDIGEVPGDLYEKPESQITAIYEKTLAAYKINHTGCCFKNSDGRYDDKKLMSNCKSNAYMAVLHQTDWLIRDDMNLVLPTPSSGGKAREKMQARYESAA